MNIIEQNRVHPIFKLIKFLIKNFRQQTYLTDDDRSIRRGNARTGCGKRDLRAVDASFADHPSCNPSYRPDYTLHWDLHEEKILLVVLRRCPKTETMKENCPCTKPNNINFWG